MTTARSDMQSHINGLTRTQRMLWEFFREHATKTVTREELSQHVWRQRYFAQSRTIDQTVAMLRKKLGDGVGSISSVRSLGYRFEPRPARFANM